MAYYRGRRGYGRRYRRWYNRRGWTRSWRSSSVKSAQQSGERRFKLVVPVTTFYGVAVAQGAKNSDVACVSPWCDGTYHESNEMCIGNMLLNDLYWVYSKLYDEVKIDWMSCELSIMNDLGGNGVPSACAIVTCVDRRVNVDEVDYNHHSDDESDDPMTFLQMRQSSSSNIYTCTNQTKKTVRRYVAASDLMERSTFHDCTIAEGEDAHGNITHYDSAWNKLGPAVNFFSPGVYFGILCTDSAPAGGYSFVVQVNVKYGLTFRNPKYGLGVDAPKSMVSRKGVKDDSISQIVQQVVKELKDGSADGDEKEKENMEDDKT